MGNDTGGAISQLVALDHGERVGRLVLTNCDCFEVFPPKEFVPMVKAARVPGALFAAVQPMRAAKARRTPLAYGWLAHEIPDEVTGAWVQPFLEDADIRRDAAAFMRAIDKATMLDAAARLPSLKIPSLVVWGQDDRFFTPELGERLATALGARLAPIAGRAHLRGRGRARSARRPHPRLRARGARGAGGLSGLREPTATPPGNARRASTPAHSANSPIACASAGRPAKNGRTSPIVSISREVVAICRSAALTVSPPRTPSASQPSIAVEVAGQRAQVGADGALLRAVEAALDADDDAGPGRSTAGVGRRGSREPSW